MRFLFKIALLATFIAVFFLVLTSQHIGDFFAKTIKDHFRLKYGAELKFDQVKGNGVTRLLLENVSLSNIKGCPPELQFQSERCDIKYAPFGILFNKFNAEFKNPRLVYKKYEIPLEVYHRNPLTTIVIKKAPADLGALSGILPKDLKLSGPAYFEGEVMLKKFSPYLLNIAAQSPAATIVSRHGPAAKGSLSIEISGKSENPVVFGKVDVSEVSSPEKLLGLSFADFDKKYSDSELVKNLTVNIDITGKNVAARSRYVNTRASGSLRLLKNKQESPYLNGKVDIKGGTCRAYGRQFKIKKGSIEFAQKGIEPALELSGETRVGKYKVFAALKGSIRRYNTVFYSQPALPSGEIVSLLRGSKVIK